MKNMNHLNKVLLVSLVALSSTSCQLFCMNPSTGNIPGRQENPSNNQVSIKSRIVTTANKVGTAIKKHKALTTGIIGLTACASACIHPAVRNLVKNGGLKVGEFAKTHGYKVGQFVKDNAYKVGEFAKTNGCKVGYFVKDNVYKVGTFAKNGGCKVSEFAKTNGYKVGHFVKYNAYKVGTFAKDGGCKVGQFVKNNACNIGSSIKNGSHKAYDDVRSGIKNSMLPWIKSHSRSLIGTGAATVAIPTVGLGTNAVVQNHRRVAEDNAREQERVAKRRICSLALHFMTNIREAEAVENQQVSREARNRLCPVNEMRQILMDQGTVWAQRVIQDLDSKDISIEGGRVSLAEAYPLYMNYIADLDTTSRLSDKGAKKDIQQMQQIMVRRMQAIIDVILATVN